MNETTNQNIRYAFIKSIPVMCGYLFLGMAFGILAQTSGFSVIWVLLLSIFVYAGSMQFWYRCLQAVFLRLRCFWQQFLLIAVICFMGYHLFLLFKKWDRRSTWSFLWQMRPIRCYVHAGAWMNRKDTGMHGSGYLFLIRHIGWSVRQSVLCLEKLCR